MSHSLIHPMVYEFDIASFGNREVKVFYLPSHIYRFIGDQQEKSKDYYHINMGGLSAVVGWSATDIDLVYISKNERGENTLCFWALESTLSIDKLNEQVIGSLQLWLSFVGIGVPREIQDLFQRSEREIRNGWRSETIDTSLFKSRSCVAPRDNRTFDILTLLASRILEGKLLNQGTPWEGRLISEGPVKDLYSGKQLLRHKPTLVQKVSGDLSGWWTESLKVFSLSTPEQEKLRVGVKFSIRNYIEVHPSRLSWDRSRQLDIYLPSDQNLSPGKQRMRCVTLGMNLKDYLIASNKRSGGFSYDRLVIDSIAEFSGVNLSAEEVGLKPVVTENFMMLPRFGSGHGDRWAPAGTGTAHPDKEKLLSVLDNIFSENGFNRVDVEKRPNKRGSSTIKRISGDASELANQLKNLLDIKNTECLPIVLFQSRICGKDLLLKSIEDVLGPYSLNGELLHFSNGLKIKIQNVPSGPLNELVDDIDQEAIDKMPQGIRWREIQRLRGIENEKSRERIKQYIEDHVVTGGDVWLALVEQDKQLRDRYEKRDPYNLVYAEVAAQGGLAQVTLFDDTSSEDQQSSDPHIYQSCIQDMLRSLGVPPISGIDYRLASWVVINTKSSSSGKPGEKPAMLSPLYVEYSLGQISVSYLNQREEMVTKGYSEALKSITLGDIFNVRSIKSKATHNAKIEKFFAEAVPRDGVNTITFIDATNIRSFVRSFSNGSGLQIDQLSIGSVGGASPMREFTPIDNNTFVRISTETDKSPSYWVENNVQGTPSGVYQEPNSERTFWITRGLPTPTQKGARISNKISRYEMSQEQYKNRYSPSISEVFVHVLGSSHRGSESVLGTMRALLRSHITTDDRDQTILPFPLHESELLIKAAK